jgi:type VI secretion system protein VasG
VAATIATRCTEVETGARNIQAILDGNVLPRLSETILTSLTKGGMPESCHLSVNDAGEFEVDFNQQASPERTGTSE